MGRPLVYTGSSYYRRGRRHKTVRSSFGTGPFTFKIMVIVSAAVLMALYITNSADNGSKSATIRQYDNQRDDLSKQLEVYKVEQVRNQTAENIKSKATERGMVQTTTEEQIGQ